MCDLHRKNADPYAQAYKWIHRGQVAESILILSAITSFFHARAKPPTRNQVFSFLTGKYVSAWKSAYEAIIDTVIDDLDTDNVVPMSNADTAQIIETINAAMSGWDWFDGIKKDIEKAILLDYVISKKASSLGSRPRSVSREKKRVAGVSVNWDPLVDGGAVDWLKNDNLYWVGKHYSKNVADDIAKIVNDIGINQGLGRKEVGKELQKALSKKFAESASYWEGLSATVLTRSSVFGSAQGMVEAGARTYKFLSVNDERTSKICKHLDGKTFRVEIATNIRDRMMSATSPEEAKEIAPWPTGQRLKEALEIDDAEALARIGIAMPPLHFHCRSEIIVEDF